MQARCDVIVLVLTQKAVAHSCCMHRACADTLIVAGMAELEDDVVALMRKRVYDVCGVLGKTVKVKVKC